MNKEYQLRLAKENERFAKDLDVHQLPDIFHYWSNKYLLPKLQKFQLTDPEQFFFYFSFRECKDEEKLERKGKRLLRAISIGAGNCDMEARLAKRLLENGCENIIIDCLDINEDMLIRGRDYGEGLGVSKMINPLCMDFNYWNPPKGGYDIVMANQALHHVVDLENLYAAIDSTMHDHSLFLVSDMIGRNGHQRWPEARRALKPFWRELPAKYKKNHLLHRVEDEFMDHDCSKEGFEGIRAQDVLPLLNGSFDYELFIPFANIIMVFIDRQFGHNFDANNEEDKAFIDRVHAKDEELLLSGKLKPTQMLSVLRKKETYQGEIKLIDPHLTPERCVRKPNFTEN